MMFLQRFTTAVWQTGNVVWRLPLESESPGFAFQFNCMTLNTSLQISKPQASHLYNGGPSNAYAQCEQAHKALHTGPGTPYRLGIHIIHMEGNQCLFGDIGK